MKKNRYDASVIIPSLKPGDILLQNIELIIKIVKKNNLKIELLIVDDSKSAIFRETFKKKYSQYEYLRYIFTNHVGSAEARNRGIKNAKGKILIFYDDDILVNQGSIARHLNFHSSGNRLNNCLLGQVIMPPEIISNSNLSRWINDNSIYFAFNRFGESETKFQFFYTCNLSIGKSFLYKNGFFDPEFKDAVYDDIELAYRLEKAGLKIVYDEKNIVIHQKEYYLDSIKRRFLLMGVYAKKLVHKHPELHNFLIYTQPSLKEFLLIRLYPIIFLLNLSKSSIFRNLFYKALITRSFFEGINNA